MANNYEKIDSLGQLVASLTKTSRSGETNHRTREEQPEPAKDKT